MNRRTIPDEECPVCHMQSDDEFEIVAHCKQKHNLGVRVILEQAA